MSIKRLQRSARHICRFFSLVLIVWLVNRSHQDFLKRLQERGSPIKLSDAQIVLSNTSSIETSKEDRNFVLALDESGNELGRLTLTSPLGDSALGFSGSTNLLIVLDQQQKVSSVSIRSSGDTIDHVDAIVEEKTFFEQFIGKTESELVRIKNIEAVSGATLTSLAIADAIALRFGGSAQTSRFPKPIQIDEVKTYFPDCEHVQPSKTHPSLFDVSNSTGQFLGKVGRTSPQSDQIIGYQGPVDTLLAIGPDGKLIGMEIRDSFENQPYSEYPNDDSYFASLFQERTLSQLASMNLVEEEVEGVSGATMTSMAMAEGIVYAASAWEVERADFEAELAKPFVNWTASDTGSFLVILLAGFVAFAPAGKIRQLRRVHQVLLFVYLGLVTRFTLVYL